MTSPYSACLILAIISLVHAAQPPPYDQVPGPNTKLLNNRDLELSWTVDWDNEEVTFTVENPFKPDRRYFMFGFTFWSDTNSSDYCLFDRDDPTKITDGSVGPNGEMRVDDQQDWHLLERSDTKVSFKRKFDTCDPYDTVINKHTMHVLWVRSNQPIVKLHPAKEPVHSEPVKPVITPRMGTMTMVVVREHDGITPMQILYISTKVPESKLIDIPILADKHVVGPDNFYLCKILKLDQLSKKKHHMVQWYPVLNYPNIHHHIALYHCDVDPAQQFELYNGDCMARIAYLRQCERTLVISGIGAHGFTFPPEAGMPIGGPDSNPFYRLEVHYANMDNKTGMIDSSGIVLRVLDTPRKYDAAQTELGLSFEDTVAIPSGQLAFPLGSRCDMGCTNAALPQEGITVFGGGFHTHSHGRRLTLHHMRRNQFSNVLFQEDYFSELAQHYFLMREPVQVLPGDELFTQCFYDTLSTNDTIMSGMGTNSEMCLQYILYYPAVNLFRCKTEVNQKSISAFFEKMKSHSAPLINLNDTNTNNYARIEWTPENVQKLHDFYTVEPLDAQCLKNHHKQWPGTWTNVAPLNFWPLANLTHWVDGNCNSEGVIPLERRRCGFMGDDCFY